MAYTKRLFFSLQQSLVQASFGHDVDFSTWEIKGGDMSVEGANSIAGGNDGTMMELCIDA